MSSSPWLPSSFLSFCFVLSSLSARSFHSFNQLCKNRNVNLLISPHVRAVKSEEKRSESILFHLIVCLRFFNTCAASSLRPCCRQCRWSAAADICPSTARPPSQRLEKKQKVFSLMIKYTIQFVFKSKGDFSKHCSIYNFFKPFFSLSSSKSTITAPSSGGAGGPLSAGSFCSLDP